MAATAGSTGSVEVFYSSSTYFFCTHLLFALSTLFVTHVALVLDQLTTPLLHLRQSVISRQPVLALFHLVPAVCSLSPPGLGRRLRSSFLSAPRRSAPGAVAPPRAVLRVQRPSGAARRLFSSSLSLPSCPSLCSLLFLFSFFFSFPLRGLRSPAPPPCASRAALRLPSFSFFFLPFLRLVHCSLALSVSFSPRSPPLLFPFFSPPLSLLFPSLPPPPPLSSPPLPPPLLPPPSLPSPPLPPPLPPFSSPSPSPLRRSDQGCTYSR